jgi:signal transduction histidine kinase
VGSLHVRRLVLAVATIAAARGQAFAIAPTKALSDCTVDVWRVRDGLPGSWVRGLHQGADGFLWIATFGGVGRYDGAGVMRVSAAPPFERAADAHAVWSDAGGTAWIVPAHGDLVCVRRGVAGDCLPAGQRLPAGAEVTAAFGESSGDVWLATHDALYVASGGRLNLVGQLRELPFHQVLAIHRDGSGRLWIGAGTGLFVRRGDRFVALEGPAGALQAGTSSLFESRTGRLWAAATDQLVRIDGERVTVYTERDGLPHARYTQVIEDRDGNVWLGSHQGLVRFRPDAPAGAPRFTTYHEQDGLPDENIVALFEDREGSLWVGTRSGGVAQFTDRTLSSDAAPPSVRGQNSESVCEDATGALWFATRDGVVRWRAGEERRFDKPEGLPSSRVFAVLPDPGGALWVGTQHGLARIRGDEVDVPVPLDAMVTALHVDPAGTLWLGAGHKVLHLERDRLVEVPPPEGFEPGDIRGIEEDGAGARWVAASNGILRVQDGRLVVDAEARRLALGGVRSIHRDAEGTLWFGGTGSGLVRKDASGFHAFGAAQGITPEQLYQVLSDREGHIWMGTSRGILRASKASLDEVARGRRERVEVISFEAFDRRRDSSARSVRQPGAWATRDGRIWFATDQGVVAIATDRLRTNTLPPPVVIDAVIVDGQRAAAGDGSVFPPGPGNLELHFGAVTLLEPDKALHRYRLEGFDTGWVEAGTRRVATYANIPAGTYRFRVQARNGDGVWNEAGAAIGFRLRPHFYRTHWFHGLVGLAVIALAWALYRARLGRLRARYLAVFAERTRVARELHDTLLQGMSAVAMQLHGARTRAAAVEPALARQLDAIAAVVSSSLDETRRFVWDLREQPSGPGDLERALARLCRRVSEGQRVRCLVHVEGQPTVVAHDLQNELFRITQEALVNALKHAAPSQVDVRLCYEAAAVKLVIRDDGRGFEPAQAAGADAGHFGLVGMRERAARIGGSLALDSRPGFGTTIAVAVPAARWEQHA